MNKYFFLLDNEIQFGTIKHLADFLEIFDIEKRENLVDVFLIIQVKNIILAFFFNL